MVLLRRETYVTHQSLLHTYTRKAIDLLIIFIFTFRVYHKQTHKLKYLFYKPILLIIKRENSVKTLYYTSFNFLIILFKYTYIPGLLRVTIQPLRLLRDGVLYSGAGVDTERHDPTAGHLCVALCSTAACV